LIVNPQNSDGMYYQFLKPPLTERIDFRTHSAVRC